MLRRSILALDSRAFGPEFQHVAILFLSCIGIPRGSQVNPPSSLGEVARSRADAGDFSERISRAYVRRYNVDYASLKAIASATTSTLSQSLVFSPCLHLPHQ